MIFWGGASTVYALLVAALITLLHEPQARPLAAVAAKPAEERLPGLLAAAVRSKDFAAILLPLGPQAGRLPGAPVIWEELRRAGGAAAAITDGAGFHALQAVEKIADLSRNAVAELFLAGAPMQVFQRDHNLLLLNDRGRVQIIDCQQPHKPKLSGFLSYDAVKYMEMQGSTAFLLLSPPGTRRTAMVVADLAKPQNPLELARFDLPDDAIAFFFSGRQLVVAVSPRDRVGKGFFYLYDLTEEYRLLPRGSTTISPLNNGFLQIDNYLVVPDLREGVHVYDCRQPLQPVLVASLVFTDQVRRLVRHGTTVFALGVQNRIYVLDLHDPLQPTISAMVGNAVHQIFLLGRGDVTYYFTRSGYLQVVPLGLDAAAMGAVAPGGIAGELMAQPDGDFILLGGNPTPLPAGISEAVPLADGAALVATVAWQQGMALLYDDGLVKLFRQAPGSAPQLQGSVQLAAKPRWLAAGGERLYVGGKGAISVLAYGSEEFSVVGQVELPGMVAWDGLVLGQTLYVAGGLDGLLSFTLADPDQPRANQPWLMPAHLQGLLDVRALAAAGTDRLLVVAGRAGLLDGRIDARGRFLLNGRMAFPTPLTAVAVINQLGLAATADEVKVIDLSEPGSLQNLGTIAFPGVVRLAVAPSGLWAGFVPGQGWSVLPAPRHWPADDGDHFECALARAQRPGQPLYRLNLYNRHGVQTLPWILNCADLAASLVARAGVHGH